MERVQESYSFESFLTSVSCLSPCRKLLSSTENEPGPTTPMVQIWRVNVPELPQPHLANRHSTFGRTYRGSVKSDGHKASFQQFPPDS